MTPDYVKQWQDVNINVLIISTEEYIVCLDGNMNVDWKTSDEYDEKGHKDIIKFNSILNSVALLETKPIHHLTKYTKENFKRMLGEAVARALDHDYVNASTALEHASNFLTDRNREKSREWHLESSGVASTIIAISGLLFWILREKAIGVLGDAAFYIILAACMGGIGSFFSICLRLGDSKIEALSDRKLHYMEASFRVISGAIGAMFGAVLVKLGIILPAFQDNHQATLAIIAIGFIAGASERLVPSLISNVENSFIQKNEDTKVQ